MAPAGRPHAQVTSEERKRIQAAAWRYVHEQAPTPPVAVLERVARIVLEARTLTGPQARPTNPPPSHVDPTQRDEGDRRGVAKGAA
jgi:hypothetical protein